MRRVLGLVVLAVALCCAPAVAEAEVPNLAWTRLLPPLPSPNGGPLPSTPGCETPSLACIDHEIERMEAVQQQLGCDHRGVFDTTYLELTRVLRETMTEDPTFFRHPDSLEAEDGLFAQYYFDMLDDDANGRPVAPAWRIALDAAKRSDVGAVTDMLLGINAHVNNDMPFVVAAIGLRTPDGESKKPDHDHFNEILNRAYPRVVHAVADRFDPLMRIENSDLTPLDDLAGLELVRGWRELVWRNAERLVNAKTDAQRATVTRQIQQMAAFEANLILLVGPHLPGYAAQRDAYCQAHLG